MSCDVSFRIRMFGESLPPIVQDITLTTGSAADHTQSLISEDENGSTSSLSDSTTRQEAENTKPTEAPKATGDVTDPDNPPTYEDPTAKQPVGMEMVQFKKERYTIYGK